MSGIGLFEDGLKKHNDDFMLKVYEELSVLRSTGSFPHKKEESCFKILQQERKALYGDDTLDYVMRAYYEEMARRHIEVLKGRR